MNIQFNAFALTLLMSGIANLLLALFVFQKVGSAVKWFSIMMLCISVWSIAYAIELASSNLNQMLLFINFEYIGITFLPSAWIVFVIKFTGKSKWLTPLNYLKIFIFPAIALLLVWTNNLHHLHYQTVSVSNESNFPLLSFQPGIWYHVHTVYFYFMLGWGIFMLIRSFQKGYLIYKKQYIAILIAALIPWITNLIYLIGYRPFQHIDLTPYAFIITSAAIAFALLKFSLFNLIPLAREKVIESMNDGVIILDWDKRIIDTNKIVSQFLGLTSDNIIGKKLNEVIKNQNLTTLLQHGKDDKTIINLDSKHFEITFTTIVNKNAIQNGTLLLFRDITENKLAEEKLQNQAEQLQKTNALKDKLFSIISHDLRTPLANLVSLLAIAKEGYLSLDELKAVLPSISENVDYTSSLIDNLLNWSKSQIDQESTVKEIHSIKEILDKEITYLSKNAADKKIEVINLINSDCTLLVDKDMMQLVFRNLISNAIKFCNQFDTITISSIVSSHKTTIIVKDTGIGMDENKLQKLFSTETFTTLGTKEEKGTGLGLHLCKDFIEKNNGQISVKSELGKGTIFTIEFLR
ncbi:MAG: histidine kinase N-terminal 7TM domain-containing protein [Bacteroidota bacterium]